MDKISYIIYCFFGVKECDKMKHFDSFEREEHRLRLTVTLGPRSLPRQCSGLAKSCWRHSDRVRLMLHFNISETTHGSGSFLPTEAWPVMKSLSDILMYFCPLKGNHLLIIYIHTHNYLMRKWLECSYGRITLTTVSDVWTVVCLKSTLHVYKL